MSLTSAGLLAAARAARPVESITIAGLAEPVRMRAPSQAAANRWMAMRKGAAGKASGEPIEGAPSFVPEQAEALEVEALRLLEDEHGEPLYPTESAARAALNELTPAMVMRFFVPAATRLVNAAFKELQEPSDAKETPAGESVAGPG